MTNPKNSTLERPGNLKGKPEKPAVPAANVASNGYWVHDEFGPKSYVPPEDAEPKTSETGEDGD